MHNELAVLLEQLTRLVRQLATAGDLSMSALMLLSRLEREGPQRLTELAHGEGVSQPGMTQLVRRLERDGWVRRSTSSTDRRGVLVEVTDAGRDLVGLRRSQRAAALDRMLGTLPPEDQAAIDLALPALTRLIAARTTANPQEYAR
ncbi:MarR family winged helix-turn-helix transcriptional regulator [Actinoplanes sp. N902-109]|uniref:MarR family winged helix-turn-helix transcriptional regulator n=1 Tax=Actinoplanes sp. (strain N902-109) TaxID=649831 RepID=UPI0003295417|nr:MarR family transcriptional regulator [Actinoplanes sp. N902-109]AGL21270.1 MarR family transcriptional regulator [Actinoplanes sp. N902-109]